MRLLSFTCAITIGSLLAAFVGCDSKTEVKTPAVEANSSPAVTPEVTTVNFANVKCPIMGGKKLDPELAVEWNGKTIGFCCDGCPQKWEKLSEEEKTARFAAATHAPDSEAHANEDPHGQHAEHGKNPHQHAAADDKHPHHADADKPDADNENQ